jgi:hypothetical protein
VEVAGSGDLAVGRGTFSFTAPVEGAPEPMQERGKWMAIWQKQADGSWLIRRPRGGDGLADLVSGDRAPGPPRAAPASTGVGANRTALNPARSRGLSTS